MRVLAKIICSTNTSFRLLHLNIVRDRATVIIEILQCFFKPITYRIGKTVPAPFRLCSKRNTLFIVLRKCLKPGCIHSISELPLPTVREPSVSNWVILTLCLRTNASRSILFELNIFELQDNITTTTIVIKSNIQLFLSIIIQRFVGGNVGDLLKVREKLFFRN